MSVYHNLTWLDASMEMTCSAKPASNTTYSCTVLCPLDWDFVVRRHLNVSYWMTSSVYVVTLGSVELQKSQPKCSQWVYTISDWKPHQLAVTVSFHSLPGLEWADCFSIVFSVHDQRLRIPSDDRNCMLKYKLCCRTLSNNNLSGPLPAALSQLQNLDYMWVGRTIWNQSTTETSMSRLSMLMP